MVSYAPARSATFTMWQLVGITFGASALTCWSGVCSLTVLKDWFRGPRRGAEGRGSSHQRGPGHQRVPGADACARRSRAPAVVTPRSRSRARPRAAPEHAETGRRVDAGRRTGGLSARDGAEGRRAPSARRAVAAPRQRLRSPSSWVGRTAARRSTWLAVDRTVSSGGTARSWTARPAGARKARFADTSRRTRRRGRWGCR